MVNNMSEEYNSIELPLDLNISFKKVYKVFEKYASTKLIEHPFHKAAIVMKSEIEKYPELISGFSDFSLLEKHKEIINLLLEPIFPEALLDNEIKAATIPFSFTFFKFSNRFEKILDNAGKEYVLNVRNLEDDSMYIMSCAFILGFVYGYDINLKRPFYFDIPDKNTGTLKYYRATFNADFTEIIPSKNAPKITEEDFKNLLNNFDNIDLWKEKFPPNSYTYNGFGLISLFDVTSEEMLSSIKANLLSGGDELTLKLQDNLRDFYSIKDLILGYSVFDKTNSKVSGTVTKNIKSIILKENTETSCYSTYFCDGIMQKVFTNHETFIISDVEQYGISTNKNPFYKNLHNQNINSIIIIPIKSSVNGNLALIEIASPRAYDLNSVNINKLKDIIPVFEAAVKRTSEEHQNVLEATIQENYTSIHSAVKWRFYEAAEKFYVESQTNKDAKLDEIVFSDVYPLFGQSDIKGSSNARNTAIQEDLTTQLTLAIHVLDKACKSEKLPIYKELMFRVNRYLKEVSRGLNAGDEISILDFLKRDIYPVFNHIKEISTVLSNKVDVYMNRLDKNLNVVYEKRKNYENSVTLLNDKLAKYLDKQQLQAQEMFPHYFERYKTDGVEFNMYIGQSLINNKAYDDLYLYNLRLWQLQTMCELENLAFSSRQNMKHDLRVASLILVHSNPMAIRFRMDEKQFDVDGAYNIRYEIIKKRIDKAHIKGTDERLTSPGKIAIVYSQDKDASEYEKYINYLQSKNQLGKIEYVSLEDLQGVSGLKALRIEVVYQKDFDEQNTITFKDLIKEIQN